jgi:hypothetical protein
MTLWSIFNKVYLMCSFSSSEAFFSELMPIQVHTFDNIQAYVKEKGRHMVELLIGPQDLWTKIPKGEGILCTT